MDMNKTFTRVGAAVGGVALSGLLLSACGGGSTAQAADTAPATTAASMPANMQMPAAASSSGSSVLIDKYMFGPDKITVPIGTAVTWTNNDADQHTVVAKDDSFRSGSLAKGQSFSFTFDKAGSYDYRCSIHPFMVATVVVTQ
jgi:plastocyanin